ncbi:MAG: fused MFS/spermidine synthase [Candidatus Omnitrophica bacterium]|nr:fused MFS/spermidine synthase [Candidatus Omnitrophota bacterium]
MRKITLLNFIVFLASFLLFQIELIISKILLPDFGGSYSVWGACVVFFQAVLFLGYFFSYCWLKKAGMKHLRRFYFVLFLFPLFFFPGKSFSFGNPVNLGIPLVINVFWYLFFSIGAVFFALSTVSVILQSWLGNSDLAEKNNPYVLFAVSNLGSFTALITYPLFFEVFLDLDQQLWFWRAMYFLLAGLIILATYLVKVSGHHKADSKIFKMNGISKNNCWEWVLFSAAGVVMFLSVTNIITYEVAPIPLLWVVPLCIYLASFVLNFKRKSWYPAWIEDKFYLVFAWSVLLFFIILMRILPFILEAVVICLFLFYICMFCQYRLYKTKPVDLDNLPLFYLIISFGGFLGGLFATWVMPVISTSINEYLVGLTLIALALSIGVKPRLMGWRNLAFVVYIWLTLIIWPMIFKEYNLWGLIIIFLIFKICYKRLFKYPRALFLSTLIILSLAPFIDSIWKDTNLVFRYRNYYGLYEVYVKNQKYVLMNGTTIHGVQYQDKHRENIPLAYYHKFTPVGELLNSFGGNKNIGVIGLGAGSLTAYAQAGQEVDYFEIDPDVYFIANNLFTFLKHSKAKINLIFGDARVQMKEAPAKRYDMLVVDAFSGDAIPVHLLTTEAIQEYRKHLTDKGMILFHISNRYLDFVPVLLSNANYLDAYAGCKSNATLKGNSSFFTSTWFVLCWDMNTFNRLLLDFQWSKHAPGKSRLMRPWSDKYSNMLLIMNVDDLMWSFKRFRPFYW